MKKAVGASCITVQLPISHWQTVLFTIFLRQRLFVVLLVSHGHWSVVATNTTELKEQESGEAEIQHTKK